MTQQRNMYLPHHRESNELEALRKRDERLATIMSTSLSILALIVLIWLICWMATDAVVKTVENEEQEARKRVYASETYRKPAAYRLHSPTQEEMDQVEHLLVVQGVKR